MVVRFLYFDRRVFVVISIYGVRYNINSIIDNFYHCSPTNMSLSAIITEDAVLNVSYPIDQIIGIKSIESDYEGRQWIPATGNLLYLRFTGLVKIEDNKTSDYFIIFDFLDVIHRAGIYPLRKSLGHCGQILPPTTMDGLSPMEINKLQADESEQLVLNMLEELGRFDDKSLLSMQLEYY
jgi:hypothetical protein